MSTPAPAKDPNVEHAQEQLELLRSLKGNDGYQQWLLPRLEELRDRLAGKIAAGGCTSFEDYRAHVALVQRLDADIFKPLKYAAGRHADTLAKAGQ